jgi:hypothetical protein
VGARFTIYGLILGRFGPFLCIFASLLVPPPFPLHVVCRLDGGIAGDAVEKAREHVPGRSWVEIARQDGSSGATTTFMGWNGGGMWRESNGHVIKWESVRGGGCISQVLGGTGERGGLINRRVNAGLL